MANFNGNLNLLGFKGAMLMSNIDQKHPQRGFVCIPIDWNEVKVSNDSTRANVRVNMWQTSDALFNAAVRNAQAKGETVPTRETFPSHTLEISYSSDFVKSIIKLGGQPLLDKVLAANPKHPEYKEQKPDDENTAFFKAIRGYLQSKLANIYVNRRKEDPAQPVAMQMAQGVTGYSAPTEDQDPFAYVGNPDEDDIPF